MPNNQQTIGAYRILEPLGRGGMGVVYRAQHLANGKIVALKTIRIIDEIQIDSIRREIRALARIHHPGVVTILDEGIENGLPWYAMELLEGMTLRYYLKKNKDDDTASHTQPTFVLDNDTGKGASAHDPVQHQWWTRSLSGVEQTGDSPPGQQQTSTESKGDEYVPHKGAFSVDWREDNLSKIVWLIRRICSPLVFLHGEGIVHRDLKPDNIFIKHDGTPVLVDFGLMTRFSGEVSRETLLVERGGVGTVHYMAPEQIRGEFVDARADLYALGCIMYELLTGHKPFIGLNVAQIMQAHLYSEPTHPSKFRIGLAPEIEEVVLRLLQKDPRDRLGYADTVAALLAPFGEDNGWHDPRSKPRAYLYRSRFTGREKSIAILAGCLGQLYQGNGDLILIGGESGVGKTRLVMEFGREVATENVLLLTGECSEISGRPLEAFQKPIQMISDRCRERGQAETDRILGQRSKVFSLYEPSCAGLPGQEHYPEPAELPLEPARMRLFSYLS
ncbi:protein kinase, partial [candidate division CSSED10-310 bacterium]